MIQLDDPPLRPSGAGAYRLVVNGEGPDEGGRTDGRAALLDLGVDPPECVYGVAERPRRDGASIYGSAGWSAGPAVLWEFVDRLSREFYEAGVDDRADFPLVVDTDYDPDGGSELRVRDHDGGEYPRRTVDDLYREGDDGLSPDSRAIQCLLVAIADAYESPAVFLDGTGRRRSGTGRH